MDNHPRLEKLDSLVVPKGWGEELIIVNNNEFCGKILKFKKGSKFSMHMHIKKAECFYVLSGHILVVGIDTTDSTKYTWPLVKGDILNIPRFTFHQIEALENSEIIEFSTHHEDSDSFRVLPGDSQK